MKKFKSLFFIVTFVLSIVVLASCAIIDDTHIHCFVNNVCECGEIEESHEHHGYVNVTFKDENGKVLEEKEVILGTLVPEVDDLSKEGYQFAGWYHGEVKWNFAKDPVKGEMVLEARFVDNAKYEIIYQLAGGAFEEEVEAFYISGIGLEKLPTPVRENHVFLGWYLNGELVEGISNSRIGSITLVAKWQVLNGSISFDLNEGSFYEGVKVPDSYNEGEGLASLPKAYRNHYIFNGWMLNGQIVDSISKEQRGAVLLEASWSPVVYEISYDLDGGKFSASEKAEYTIEDEFNLVDATKVGYTFLGWYLGNELVESVKVGTTGELNFKAKWQINKYTISFDSNGGSKVDALTQDYNSSVVAPTAPTREGYSFAGWDQDVPTNMPAENITLTAKWNINKYTVTFKLGNGEKDVVLTQDYQTTITSPVPERTGYTFAGWDKEVLDKVPAEDLVYTAKWNINKYTVTFKLENGEEDVVLTQDYQTTISAPVPERTGYTFAGWDKEVLDKVPAEDLVYTAKWNINKYTVTFKLENGEKDVVLTQDYQTTITAPVPERTGYTFAGWDKEVLDKVPAEDLVYTAKWNINKYTVTFKLGNGEEDVVLTLDYQSTITAPVPERTGYTFAGWDKDVLDKVPAEDLVYTAKWTINQYNLIINIDGEIEKVEYDYNEAILKPADPEKVGYTFAGWDKEVPANMPAEDVEIKATWKAVEYKISYNLVGGAIYEGTVYPSNAEKEFEIGDYYTDGGNLKADIVVSDISILPNNSLKYQYKILLNYNEELDAYEVIAVGADNITAKDLANGQTWTHALTSSNIEIHKQVTVGQIIQMPELSTDMDPFTAKVYNEADLFISNNKQTYTIEELVKLPIATKAGYEFLGWYIGEDKVEEIAKGSTGDVSLVAKWNIVEYTISYELAGGAHVGAPSDSYTVLEEVALGVATKVGYNFLGWYIGENKVEEIAKGSTGNISLVAKWEAIQYQINYDAQGGDLGIIVYTYELIGTDFLADFNILAGQSLTPTTFAANSSTSVKTVFANAEFLAKWSWMFAFMLEDLKAVNPDATSAYLTDAYPVLEKMIAGDTAAILDNANARTMIRNNIGGMLLGAKGCPSNPTFQKYAADFSEAARQEALVKAANDANEFKYTIEDEVELIVPTRKGYEFLGWYIGEEKVEKVEVGTTGNLTLTAKWDAIEYQITYDLGNGTHDASPVVSYTIEDNITLGTASKRGYRFLGWLLNEELVTEIAKGTTGNIKLVASWEYQGVKSPITYTLNGGSWAQDYVVPETYDEGMGLDLSSIVPVYRGYRFAGWKLNEEIVTEISAEQIEAVTLVATWEIETYQITYVLDGGNEDHGNPTSYNVTSDTIVLKPLTKADYEFVGWFDGETQVEQIEKGSTGDLTLTARWEISSFDITYNPDGGEYVYNEIINSEIALYFNLIRFNSYNVNGYDASLYNRGYTRTWWYSIGLKTTEHKNVYEIIEIPLMDKAGVSTFTTTPDYAIVWHSALTDANSKASLSAISDDPAKYVGQHVVLENIPAEDSTSCNITGVACDAENIKSYDKVTSYKPGDEFDLIPLVKTGYTFEGWVTEDDEVITSITSEQNGNLSLTAKWEANTYNITYELNGGSFGSAYVNKEELVNDFLVDFKTYSEVVVTKDNFFGITYGDSASKVISFFEDATYGPKWSWMKEYILDVAVSTNYDKISSLEDDNSTFWRRNIGSFINDSYDTSWPAGIDFTVDANANGFWGKYVTKLISEYKTGSELALPIPTRANATFAGWYDGDTKVESITNTMIGDLSLTARWLILSDISYNLDGGTIPGYYTTRQEMVDDFMKDLNEYKKSLLSANEQASYVYVAAPTLADASGSTSAFYTAFNSYLTTYYNQSANFITQEGMWEKWGWMYKYIATFTGSDVTFDEETLSVSSPGQWTCSVIGFLTCAPKGSGWPCNKGDFSNESGLPSAYKAPIALQYDGSVDVALPTPEKAGYVFLGWYNEEDQLVEKLEAGQTGDVTLTARWELPRVTLNGVGYASLEDAIAAAKENDVITLLSGTIGKTTINVAGLTFLGPNADVNPVTSSRSEEFIFTGDVVVAADNVTIKGVKLEGAARIVGSSSGISNLLVENVLITGSTVNSDSSNGPLYFVPASNKEYTNIKIINTKICDYNSNRPMILFGYNFNGLTIEGCSFIAVRKSSNDGIKINSGYGLKGDVVIKNNHFENYAQYTVWLNVFSAGNYQILNNEFINCGTTGASTDTYKHGAITFGTYKGTNSETVTINASYNTNDNSYILFRINANASLSDTNTTIAVNYNKVLNSKTGYYVHNASTVSIDAKNNYYSTAPTAASFSSNVTWDPYYATEGEVPAYSE